MSLRTSRHTFACPRPLRAPRLRLGLALLLGLAGCLVLAPAALARFSVKSLRLGSASGAVDYLFAAGNRVVEQGTVDRGRYYRFDVYDAAGTVHWSSACRPATANGSVSSSYTLQSSDPDSGATGWRFRLREFSNASSCNSSGSGQNDGSLYFGVASATSYSSSALTSPRSAFAAGKTAYVQVAGVGRLKSSGSNAAQATGSWSTSWILPSGATACANTAGSDLPGSAAGGQLPATTSQAAPAGPNLQYPPASSGGLDPWNLQSNYEATPCPALASGNQGQWKLMLRRDSTHFVTLPVFTADTVTPETTLTSGPASVTASTSASFTFTSSEPGSTFQCSLDGATATTCTSPQTYTGLSAGTHTFSVAAVNAAGNVDPTPAASSWTVNTTTPNVNLTSPAPGSYTNDTTPTFSGTAETKSGDSNVTVKLYAGPSATGTPAQTLSAVVQAGGSWTVNASTLVQGTYTTQAQQTNAANTTGFSEEESFTVDTTPPAVTLYTPVSGTHTNDTMPQITGTAGTAFSDVPTVTVTLVGVGSPVQLTTSVSSSGNWEVDLPSALADGNYTVQAAQKDLAGNKGSDSSSLTIDTAPPQTFVDAAPTGVTSSTTATFGFHATDALSQAGTTFICQLDGGNWAACSSPQTYRGLANGTHTLWVDAVDGAGNVDPTGQTTSWTVNTSLPAITLQTPAEGSSTNQTTPAFSGTAGTAAGDASTVQVPIYTNTDLSGSPVQTLNATVASDGTWSATPPTALADGTYVAYAQQLSSAGTATSDAHSFTVNTHPPTTTINVGPPGNSGTGSANFSFTSSEPGSSFQCQLDGGGWTACASPQDYSGLGAGSHTFQVRATDAAGNVGPAASQTWSVNTKLPALSLASPGDGTFTNNRTPTIAGVGGTASGDASTLIVDLFSGTSIAGSPLETITTTVASGTGAWTTQPSAPLGDGTYTVYAQQVGSAGTAYTAASTFTVDTIPPTTVITSEPQGTTASTGARFAFTASEPGSTFQCQLDSGAWTTCTSPQSYSSLSIGTHTFSVRATDPAGNVDPDPPVAAWTIDPTVPVSLTAPADGTVTNDNTPTFSGAASAANGPVSLEIDDSSGNPVEVLSAGAGATWSATASPGLDDGSYTAVASQLESDGVTTDYSNAIGFTIDTTPPTTTITGGPAGSTTANSASFDFTSSETGSIFQCHLDSGSWVVCASPQSYSSLPVGSHTFSVRATDAAGNTDPTPPSRTWIVTDVTPPSNPSSGNSATPSSPTPSGTPSSGSGSQPGTANAASVKLALRARGTQHLHRRGAVSLVALASCSRACTLALTGRVTTILRSRRGHKASTVTLLVRRVTVTRVPATRWVKVKINLTAQARKALLRALARKQRLTLTLSAIASVPGLGSGSARLAIRLVV